MMNHNRPTVIHSRESLREEQRRLMQQISGQEQELRQRVQRLPGEIFYAGADAVLPAALSGRISDRLLQFTRNFINKSVVKKSGGHASRLVIAAKQAGIFTIVRFLYNTVIRRRG